LFPIHVSKIQTTAKYLFFNLFLLLNGLTMLEFLRDMWSFLKVRKKWWLAPIIIFLLILGVLLIFGGSTAVAPFIYSLF